MEHYHDRGLLGWLDGGLTSPHPRIVLYKQIGTKQWDVWKLAASTKELRTWTGHFTGTNGSHWRRKWQPTPVFLPGESQGRGSLVGCRVWGCTELDTTEVTWRQQQQQQCIQNQSWILGSRPFAVSLHFSDSLFFLTAASEHMWTSRCRCSKAWLLTLPTLPDLQGLT